MEGHVRMNEVRNVSFAPIVGITVGIRYAAIASAVTRCAGRQQPCDAPAHALHHLGRTTPRCLGRCRRPARLTARSSRFHPNAETADSMRSVNGP